MSIPLFLHVLSGFTALACGSIILILKKGTKRHRSTGKIFYYAMLSTGMTALWLSLLRPNPFLLTVAIFSLYQTLCGRRAITHKSLIPGGPDYILTGIILVNGSYMIYTMNTVLIVFGSLCVVMGIRDLMHYIRHFQHKKPAPNTWLIKHIGMMTGSYIATMTAFLVVNMQGFRPEWLVWLAPTFVLTPLMIYYQRREMKRLQRQSL